MKEKAIFLDRDGTVIVDKNYLSNPDQIEYISGVIEALKYFQESNFLLFLVTNQSGIGRGLFKKEEMYAVHDKMQQDMIDYGLRIYDKIVFCPHSPNDNCNCRKPSPNLILELIAQYNIDPKLSYMIGDKTSDTEAGKRAGVTGILLTDKNNPKKKIW